MENSARKDHFRPAKKEQNTQLSAKLAGYNVVGTAKC
jgi:hypothetical protein